MLDHILLWIAVVAAVIAAIGAWSALSALSDIRATFAAVAAMIPGWVEDAVTAALPSPDDDTADLDDEP
jgi:hypothetical protein